jgi:DNA gyrase subunit B
VQRKRFDRALSNKEIKAVVAALGAGVKNDFDLDDMRYGRVAILVDADVDGDHIKTLLYTLFWRLMRPMVDAGRLYVAQAPLYQVSRGRNSRYAYSDTERDRIIEEWGGKQGISVQRYKGLGEMNPEQLRETVFSVGDADAVDSNGSNPALNEHMARVVVSDVHAANAAFALWMASGASKRRERLMRYWGDGVMLENGEA